MSERRARITLSFGFAALFAVAVAGVTWHLSLATNAREVTNATHSVSVIPRDQIIARVTAMSAIAKRIDRIDAKLTTWAAYRQSHELQINFFQDPTPGTTPVWVVAVAGNFVAPHTRGEEYPWGVIVYDAANGEWIYTEATRQSSWPGFFDGLTGISPP